MKKMEEMDQNIRLRSEGYGFRFVILLLTAWIMYNCYLAFSAGQKFNIVPTLILTGASVVRGISEVIMKQKMIAGDEEYKEPNRVVWGIITLIAVIAMIGSVGFYVLRR